MMKYIFFLASGNSSRFGENKLLKSFNGKPLFRHGLDTLKGLCKEDGSFRLCLVSRFPELLAYAEENGIKAVYCPESEKGLSYTVKAAVKSIEKLDKDDKLLFQVADQPFIKKESVRKLFESDGKIARLSFGQRVGNPVVFSASLADELLSLTGDNGGKRLCEKYGFEKVFASSEAELEDIDTAEAFEEAEALFKDGLNE